MTGGGIGKGPGIASTSTDWSICRESYDVHALFRFGDLLMGQAKAASNSGITLRAKRCAYRFAASVAPTVAV